MIRHKRSKPNIFKVLFTKPFYRVTNRKPLAGLDTIGHVIQRAFVLFYHITMISDIEKKVMSPFFRWVGSAKLELQNIAP